MPTLPTHDPLGGKKISAIVTVNGQVYIYNSATDRMDPSSLLAATAGVAGASQAVVLDASKEVSGIVNLPTVQGFSFTEDGSSTSYVATAPLVAGSLLLDILFTTTVLWDGTSQTLIVGDDDDDNGFFDAVNLKAADLLVGEVLSVRNSWQWGGKQGAYLVEASGKFQPIYYPTANNIIAKVTPGAGDGSAGRSFMWVVSAAPTLTASTNT